MISSAQTGWNVSTDYKIKPGQGKTPESTAYFVLEHQPRTCEAYPSNGNMTFSNIYLEVEGKQVKNVQWQAKQERPKCNSKATVVDSETISFSWSPTDVEQPAPPVKWGHGN
jgi:hypothetical protein